jgi:hypothetical protein
MQQQFTGNDGIDRRSRRYENRRGIVIDEYGSRGQSALHLPVEFCTYEYGTGDTGDTYDG